MTPKLGLPGAMSAKSGQFSRRRHVRNRPENGTSGRLEGLGVPQPRKARNAAARRRAWGTSGQRAGRAAASAAATGRPPPRWSRRPVVEIRPALSSPARGRPASQRAASSSASPAHRQPPSPAVEQFQRRPTARTGDRLGVESPVGRIRIFGRAVGAEGKLGHRSPRPVVGQLAE